MISDFCIDQGGPQCVNSVNSYDSVVISFKRPNPDARFKAIKGGNPQNFSLTRAAICVKSNRGDKTGIVTIESNGQISISQNLTGVCTI